MTFTIKKAKIERWGYEITGRNFHNIAPTKEAAKKYLLARYGRNIKIIIKD